MKVKIIPILIIVVLAVGAAAFLISKKPVEPTPEKQTVQATSSATTVEIRTLTYASSTNSVTIEYPQFSGMPVLNARIQKEAEELFATTTAESKANATDLASLGVDLDDRDLIFERKIDRTKTYINDTNKIASITYRQYIDSGGAHGTFFFGSAAYDLGTGETLMLGNFLKDYQVPLEKYVRSAIRNASATTTKSCLNCEGLNGTIWPDDAKMQFTNFSLREDGLVLLFGAYEFGPYAATSAGQEILVTKEALKDMAIVTRVW